MRSGNAEHRYAQALAKAQEIEAELKLLRRWSSTSLPPEKFENMGAFGSNSMTFEQWIQFVLIPRIHAIVADQDDFPDGSMLGPYAIRVFDGDLEASKLHDLLYELDEIINHVVRNSAASFTKEDSAPDPSIPEPPKNQTVTLGDTTLPSVLYTLTELLPQFDGDGLESQLQTFDMFLEILSPAVRPQIAHLLSQGADKHANIKCQARIKRAAESVLKGGRAAEPYDHDKAIKSYINDFHKNS